MDKKTTLIALKKSIKKWEEIVEGTGDDNGRDNCALCELFFFQDNYCEGCPVYQFTSETGCKNTPYDDWRRLHIRNINDLKDEKKESAIKIAKKELKFLKSLLEK
jgi:hypothetical protein